LNNIEKEFCKIICVTGYAGAGKDTFIDYLINLLKEGRGIYSEKFSIIDPVKSIAKQFGYLEENKNDWRDFLAGLKVLLDNKLDFSHQKIKEKYEQMINYFNFSYLFIICRSKEDVLRIKKDYKSVVVLYISKNEVEDLFTNDADLNADECRNICDFMIYNNGTKEHLKQTAYNFIDYI